MTSHPRSAMRLGDGRGSTAQAPGASRDQHRTSASRSPAEAGECYHAPRNDGPRIGRTGNAANVSVSYDERGPTWYEPGADHRRIDGLGYVRGTRHHGTHRAVTVPTARRNGP